MKKLTQFNPSYFFLTLKDYWFILDLRHTQAQYNTSFMLYNTWTIINSKMHYFKAHSPKNLYELEGGSVNTPSNIIFIVDSGQAQSIERHFFHQYANKRVLSLVQTIEFFSGILWLDILSWRLLPSSMFNFFFLTRLFKV